MARAESERQKLIQEKCQVILGNLLREEDNKYCVDCDAKGPRWASWNLGVFLCIRCAGIHRNLGVHISKVKSVNLDTWTAEQVACLQQMGNSQARAVYEANLPDNFRRPQTDSTLEAFIRGKYEQKKFIAKEWVPPPAPKPAFDIEEEKRKEKERKKSRNKISSSVEIPTLPQHPTALPRPHSAGPQSPSTKAVVQENSKTSVQQVPGPDLLNLGDVPNAERDDIFDAFLSAPQSTAGRTSAPTTPSVAHENSIPNGNKSADEADFFNQMCTADASQSNKMTKESILSLYGSNACQMPATQPMPPVYGLPGGMFVGQQAFTHVGVPAYHTAPNQAMNVNNSGTNVSAVYNPFAALGTSAIRPDTRLQPNAWLGLQPGGGTDPLLMTHGIGQVQQQMANLQLTGQTWNVGVNVAPVNQSGMVVGNTQTGAGIVWPTTNHGPSLSSNLWQ